MAHWSESYIGRPYVPESADCAILYYTVSREVFGKDVPDIAAIKRAASRLGRMTQMADAVAAYGEPVSSPVDGDAVLMMCLGRPSHIGVYCLIDGEAYVLHAMENAGMVCMHRLRDLPRIALSVEGFYRWK